MTILSDEITNDPLERDYANMSDIGVVIDMNTPYRTENKVTMSAWEIMQAINPTEFSNLSAANEATVWNVLHLQIINPFGLEASLLTNIFGANSVTITALKLARKINITRTQELKLPKVKVGHVMEARA